MDIIPIIITDSKNSTINAGTYQRKNCCMIPPKYGHPFLVPTIPHHDSRSPYDLVMNGTTPIGTGTKSDVMHNVKRLESFKVFRNHCKTEKVKRDPYCEREFCPHGAEVEECNNETPRTVHVRTLLIIEERPAEALAALQRAVNLGLDTAPNGKRTACKVFE